MDEETSCGGYTTFSFCHPEAPPRESEEVFTEEEMFHLLMTYDSSFVLSK